MTDLLFAIEGDRQTVLLEGDDAIHNFVEQTRRGFPGSETNIEAIYNRIGLLEPDPRVRDRLMARFFVIPIVQANFKILSETSDEIFAMYIRNIKDHLSYKLFPMAPELDRNVEERYELAFGGALMRSLWIAPIVRGSFSFFNQPLIFEHWVQ